MKLVRPGYARAPYQSVDHVMAVAAGVFTGANIVTDPKILDSLPVNMCILGDLANWGARFCAATWLRRNNIRVASRAYKLNFYEPCDHDLSKLRHSEHFGGVVVVDKNYKIIACIPTVISWSEDVVLISFKHNNRWNTGRLGRAYAPNSKGACWHLKAAFVDNKENVHTHEVFDDARLSAPRKYMDLFIHTYQKTTAAAYKRLCDAVAGHVFEGLTGDTEQFDIPTPQMIYRTPCDSSPRARGLAAPLGTTLNT